MKLGELLPNLSGVRKGGQGYVAKCPAHDDHKASLSLAEDSGRILIKCFAGCETATIVGKLNITFRDLFDRNIAKPSFTTLGRSIRPTVQRHDGVVYFGHNVPREHCVYPYVDEENRLLYENVRFYPKDFRARRFDVRGEPVWNLEGVTRVPYRLPELIAAAKKNTDIFLCEGEKDADALRDLGFAASSFKNWSNEFNSYIEGCHIVIVRDHDVPGVTQSNEAARIVLKAAASVKVIDMFEGQELPEKSGSDISDYIHRCVTDEGMDVDLIKERICLAIEQTANWKDPQPTTTDQYFVIQSGNEWMSQSKSQAIPKKLFGEFWFENEVCILFADTNVGKSILAVQIADAISKNDGFSRSDGTPQGVTLTTECVAQKIIYYDFELTAKQFESRFSERVEGSDTFINHYQFHRNFYRAEINPETSDMGGFKDFEEFLNSSLESTIVSSGAKIVIIDNLTYLRDETENARNALPLMKYLKKLKAKHGLSILALAHTPKRDSTKPLGRNDLQGSKMLINFCDSSFAIGESAKQPGLRYLKQIKARNTEIIYHTENVLLASVVKSANFLHFEFLETAAEADHLKVLSNKQRDELKEEVKKLSESGLSSRKIAEKLGISAMSVTRYLKA